MFLLVAPLVTQLLRIGQGLALTALLAFTGPAAAGQDAPRAGYVLQRADNAVPISSQVQLLRDPSRTLRVDDVRRHSEGWTPGPADAINIGFSRDVVWVRLRVTNPFAEAQHMQLDTGSALQDHVDSFTFDAGGALVSTFETGDRRPFHSRPIPTRTVVLPFSVPSHSFVDLYLRLDTHDGLFEALPLRLSNANQAKAHAEGETLALGIYYGAIFALGVYNLFLFLSTRGLGFGYYVAYLAGFLGWGVVYRGYGLAYLWPDHPDLNNIALCITANVAAIGFGLFSMTYLRVRQRLSRSAVRLSYALIGLYTVPTVLGALDWYTLSWFTSIPLGLALIVWSNVISWRFLRLKYREARFFCPAFAFIGVGVGCTYAAILGVAPVNWLTTWGLQVGSFFEVVLLAFGLADSMNTLKAQKLEAERQARETQLRLNQSLEKEVGQRTAELQQANDRLRTLSITDELTGAFNRRHFNASCRALLSVDSRRGGVALCMFDIDHFKAYNDHYGHQAGDAVLRDAAAAVSEVLHRTGDCLFRLGGEEFGVLFTAQSRESSVEFAERLRVALRSLDREHARSPLGIVTASFGVAWWDEDDIQALAPESMYRIADTALYAAKTHGRDQVFSTPGSPRLAKDLAAG